MGFAEEGKMPLMMHEVEVGDHIRDADQRFVYAYDFLTMWMFLVERIGTGDPDPALTYPRVAMSVGKAPSERSRNALLGIDLEEEEFYGSLDGDDPYDEDDEDERYGGSSDDLGDEYR